MGDRADAQRAEGERELDAIAGRLAGAFATLNEFPSIRWVLMSDVSCFRGWGRWRVGKQIYGDCSHPTSDPHLTAAPTDLPPPAPRFKAGRPVEPGDAPGAHARSALTHVRRLGVGLLVRLVGRGGG
jgi:hypothetical protein